MKTAEDRARPRREAPLTCGLLRLVRPSGEDLGPAVPDDVSSGGARLLVLRPCPAGAPLGLVPLVPGRGHPLSGRHLAFRATRCEWLGGGLYRLAGKFDPKLSRADVLALAWV